MSKENKIIDSLGVLKAELRINRIDFGSNRFSTSEPFLGELLHSISITKHEGKISSYGAMFVMSFEVPKAAEFLRLEPSDFDLARSLADGVHSFVLIDTDVLRGVIVLPKPCSNERQLVETAKEYDALIITRNQRGTTKVFHEGGITLQSGRLWQSKPPVETVLDRVSAHAPQIDLDLLTDLLEFAFHELSADGIGATIVWLLQEPLPEEVEKMTPAQDLSDLRITVRDEIYTSPLKHVLRKTDGAILISGDGHVIGIEAQLKYSEESARLIPPIRGTRHTSARRFSFDIAKCIGIVVSEDGPITIFSDGLDVATLSISTHPAEDIRFVRSVLKKALPELADSVSSSALERKCGTCGKTSRVEEVVVPMFREREEVYCPLCNNLLYSSLCYSLRARLIKSLDALD